MERFAPLRPEFAGAPFWFWNDDLDPVELRRQIHEMHEQNVGGFFMHARMGRVTPYMSARWMECVRACVDEAERLGMNAWIYDEDGWPSGYGGGLVNALGEEYLQKYATPHVLERQGDRAAVPEGGGVLAAFMARRDGERLTDPRRIADDRVDGDAIRIDGLDGDVVVVFVREINNYRRHFAPECWTDGYVDVLNPKVTRAFIRKIYEPYRRQIGAHFGRTVPGVFTDEPNYHDRKWFANEVRLPWSPVLETEFRRRYGRPLGDALFDIAYGTGDAFRARWCFYAAAAHLFATNYTKTLAQWCAKHNLIFTGHVLLEESPRAATQTIGDPMLHYVHQQAPGIDHLGKGLDLAEFWSSARVLVKQAASVAHQFDKPRVLCETFAGGGWDFGPLEQKWMGDWQYALGLNLLCQHAFHYSLRGYRKRDYPPSLSYQQPWWRLSAPLGAHFARLGDALTQGTRVVNVLVLHPIESFFATHDTAGYPWRNDHVNDALKRLVELLLAHQIDFDFGNEELLRRHGRVEDPQIVVGTGRYDVVIVPHALTWRGTTLRTLERFAAAGGRLFHIEPLADHVDAKPSPRVDRVLARGASLGRWDADDFEPRLASAIGEAARPAVRLHDTAGRSREIVMMHRRADDHDVFFFASAAKDAFAVTAELRAAGVPHRLDTVRGVLEPWPHERAGETCRIALEFDYGRSHVIAFEPDAAPVAASAGGGAEVGVCKLGDAVEYQLLDPNALILDRGVLIVDGHESERIGVLEARLRMQERPLGTPGRLRLTFESRVAIDTAWLLVETPERFAITANGESVRGGKAGWFVDASMRRMRIPGGVRPGTNTVEVSFEWQPDLELEPLYVLGDFGVYESQGRCHIDALPERLAVGPWERQGLAFYAGSVAYRLHADVEPGARRWELAIGDVRTAAKIVVNGCDVGSVLWPPYRIDVTGHLRPGPNRIDVVVANSLRNFLGPHHMNGEDDIPCLGPHNFFEKNRWVEEYRFLPAGLLGAVTLHGSPR